MDTVDILKVCFRRWYIMLPILLGAAGVSYQLVEAQETTYTAHASYGLVQPSPPSTGASGGQEPANPLGANNGALIGAALEAQLNSRETQQELGSDATRGWGPGEVDNGSSFSVKIPLYETTYEVRAWGEDEREVRGVVSRVIDAAPDVADELQDRAGAPATGRYRPFMLAPVQVEAEPSTSGKKLVVAVMGIGVLMGAAWSIVADRLLRQVSRRRAANRNRRATPARPNRINGQADRALDQPVPPGSTEPEAPPEEPPEPGVQEPAETNPRSGPGRDPVVTGAGGQSRKPQGTGQPDSGMTPHGQRRPTGKVIGPPGRAAQQRRSRGG